MSRLSHRQVRRSASCLSAAIYVTPILIAVTLLLAPKAGAANQWWDTSATTGLQAGPGDWINSNGVTGRRWQTSATPGTAAPARWTQGNDAIFSPSGISLVSVTGTDVTVNSITFDGTGYTIGGAGTLNLTGSNITANADATISVILNGTVGLT